MQESDLHYDRARSFDPSIGRWISDDPLGYESAESNMFSYPPIESPMQVYQYERLWGTRR